MPQIDNGLVTTSPTTSLDLTPTGMRRALGALLQSAAPGVPNAGVFLGNGGSKGALQVSTGGGLTYSVAPGYAVITRGDNPTLGGYWVGSVSTVTVSTAAGDTTNPRIDRVYICQPDYEQSDSGVPRIDVVQGVPSSTPALPALPNGSLELARITVPKGMSATSQAALTDTRPFTSVAADWSTLTGKPSTFPPSSHTHPWSALTGGTIPDSSLPSRLDSVPGDISGTDLNSAILTGWYRGSNMSNAPSSDWYFVTVVQHSPVYVSQVAIAYTGGSVGQTFTRVNANGAWTAWLQTATADSVNAEATARANADNAISTVVNGTGTVVSGWTLNRFSLRKVNHVVHLDLSVTRTGSGITSGSSGNIGNLQVGNVGSWKPMMAWNGLAPGPGGPVTSCAVDSNGVLWLCALPQNWTLATGDELTAGGSWATAS